MADKFSYEVLSKVVAQICQLVGFERTTTSALYTLTDIFGSYLRNLGSVTHRYAEHCGRLLVNDVDLSIAFHDFNIIPSELVEFLELASPLPEPLSVPKYPLVRNNESFLEKLDILGDSDEKPGEIQNQVRENLKIKISLKKIKEANKKKKSKSKMKRKRNKENRRKRITDNKS